ncbi:MAG: prenyltransferase/squalene oxidase repeat-containing protein [Candidatus Jacksonbacteria bacterium]
MKKLFFIFLLMFFVPISVRADYDQQKTVDYLKDAPQNYWTTQALYQLGQTDIDGGHLRSVICDSAIDCAGPILGITALGEDPRTFTDQNLINILHDSYQTDLENHTNINDSAFAILALKASGEQNSNETIIEARNYILDNQNTNGGWAFAVGFDSDTDVTAMSVMALLEVNIIADDLQIINAVDFVKTNQNQDGGFHGAWDDISNANSTAWALSTIYKLGQDPEVGDWAKEEGNPVSFLKTLQNDSGYFGYQSAGEIENAYSAVTTAQAAIALAGGYYPVRKISYSPPAPPPRGGGILLLPANPAPAEPNLTSQTYIPAGAPAKVQIKNEKKQTIGEIIISEKFFTKPVTLFTKALKKEELSESQQSINLISPYVYDLQILDGDQKEVIEFDDEIEIKLFYQNSDLLNLIKPDELQIVYWDKANDAWIALEKNQIDSSQKSVRALTKHFTLFAISYGLEAEKPSNMAGRQRNLKTEKRKNRETAEPEAADEFLSYPDGTLIKTIANPAVYLIEQGRKRWIPNEKILRFRFLGQEIEFVDQEIIDSLPEGMEVLYPNGVYLRSLEDSQIYRIKNNKKYQVRSLETWLYICDQEAPVLIDVGNKELNQYEIGGLVV